MYFLIKKVFDKYIENQEKISNIIKSKYSSKDTRYARYNKKNLKVAEKVLNKGRLSICLWTSNIDLFNLNKG